MLNSSMNVTILRVSLSELLVGLQTLLIVFSLLADLQEVVKQVDSLDDIAKLLVDVTHLLVAFGLLVLVLGRAGSRQTLTEEA